MFKQLLVALVARALVRALWAAVQSEPMPQSEGSPPPGEVVKPSSHWRWQQHLFSGAGVKRGASELMAGFAAGFATVPSPAHAAVTENREATHRPINATLYSLVILTPPESRLARLRVIEICTYGSVEEDS